MTRAPELARYQRAVEHALDRAGLLQGHVRLDAGPPVVRAELAELLARALHAAERCRRAAFACVGPEMSGYWTGQAREHRGFARFLCVELGLLDRRRLHCAPRDSAGRDVELTELFVIPDAAQRAAQTGAFA